MYSWETGMGVVADQTASNEYKRGKAEKLARKIDEYREKYPEAPITLIGLSAGTAIAVFTLEALPPDLMVENVILLSGSLSATYDLTKALQHVRGKVYITTSHKDAVLGGLLPMTGTADRQSGTTQTIGVDGAMLPASATSETRSLYASKVVVAPWKEEYAKYGDRGGHTDTVASAFVARYVAPLVKTTSGKEFATGATRRRGTVKNPDYERWARAEIDSWVLMEGQQTVGGVAQPVRVRGTLVSKSADQLTFQFEPLSVDGQHVDTPFATRHLAPMYIIPEEHPTTHPASQIRKLPDAKIRVGARELTCEGKTITASADFPDWGSHPQATVYTSDQIPSGIVKIDIKTQFSGQSVVFSGQVVDFLTVQK
jgi:hypothetical protein